MYKVIIPVDDTTAKVEYFDKPKYVFKQTNGVIITTDDPSKADGILCHDNSVIYAFKDKQLDTEDSEYQICYMYEIDMNTYIKEMDDIKKQQESSISSNSTQITEAQTALVDIFESSLNTGVEVESLSEQMTESQTALVDVFESTLENSTNIDNLDTQMTESQVALVDIYELILANSTSISQLSESLNTLNTTVSGINTRVETLEQGGGDSVNAQIDRINNEISDLSSTLDEVMTKVNELHPSTTEDQETPTPEPTA